MPYVARPTPVPTYVLLEPYVKIPVLPNFAFAGCSNLTNITFNGTRTQWNAITKDYSAIPSGVTVSFPDGSTITI